MSELRLEVPSRQSPVGIAVIFVKNLRIAINILLSVVAVSVGFRTSFWGLDLYTLGALVIALFFVISILQYRRFFFYVEDEYFVIEKGLLSRDKITVPFDRIQTVNIKQNIIQQLLGVVALNIDTAGSSKKEMEISALRGSYARELQRFLVAQKERHGSEEIIESEENVGTPKVDPWEIAEGEPLVKLGLGDLLRIGLTENHLRTGLVVFAIINGYIWQYEEYLLDPVQPYIEEQTNFLVTQYMIIAPVALIVFLTLSVMISLVQTVLRYFGLKFFVGPKGVQMVSGLFRRVEYQIPINKIQYLKWKSNPLRKLIGLKTLVIKQASSMEAGDRQSVKVPGCNEDQLERVLEEFYPEKAKSDFFEQRPQSLLGIQLSFWVGLLPTLLMLPLAIVDLRLLAIPAVYLAISLFFIWKYASSMKLEMSREMFMLTKGWVFPSTLALKFYKLQNVKLSQSVFQKRRGLASITFHTAAGDETMPHIPYEQAVEIYDYVLYKIQSDSRDWM